MNFYRCRICGETYLGTKAPSRCPYCGVTEEYFLLTSAYPDHHAPELSDTEKADVQHAIELERGNSRFYRALGMKPGNAMLSSAFKRLSAIEAEHCSLYCKLLGVDKPVDLLEPADGHGTWCEDVNESLARELRASQFYTEAAGRARHPRVTEVFLALSAVERDHIELDGIAAQLAD